MHFLDVFTLASSTLLILAYIALLVYVRLGSKYTFVLTQISLLLFSNIMLMTGIWWHY